MTEQEFNKVMEHIISSLKQGGYDPYEQLTGYITTGEIHYITRKGNAEARAEYDSYHKQYNEMLERCKKVKVGMKCPVCFTEITAYK